MVRGLPLERCCFVVSIAALVACAGAADAANTSRPTGRGAIRDNSVYCQNSPGQPARPEYRGTGSQNPFGGECGPGPAVQPEPQPQEEAEEDDACPAREASLQTGGVILAANTPGATPTDAEVKNGLWVAEHPVGSAREVGLGHLTERRKEIFEGMRCSRNRLFQFKDEQRLKDTIELRAKIIERMEGLLRGSSRLCFDPSRVHLPSEWQFYSEPKGTLETAQWHKTAARSKPGVSADKAIQSLRAEGATLECHWGMQMTVLDAAHEALGKNRFNEVHPVRSWPNLPPQDDGRPSEHALAGLGVPLLTDEDVLVFWSHVVNNASYTSLAEHVFVVRYHRPDGFRNRGSRDPANDQFAGKIEAADMVPGDWAYLKNVPDYETLLPDGAFAGENAFYIRERTKGDPKSRVFYGFGLSPPEGESAARFQTQLEIATAMAKDFNEGARDRRFDGVPEDMVWTRLGSPILDDTDLRESGPFVR
jgi:hypothetical protein